MKKRKAVNGYSALLEKIRNHVKAAIHDRSMAVSMLRWHRDSDPGRSSKLSAEEIYQRTAAADSLGYDVLAVSDKAGLSLIYVKRSNLPEDWKPTDE